MEFTDDLNKLGQVEVGISCMVGHGVGFSTDDEIRITSAYMSINVWQIRSLLILIKIIHARPIYGRSIGREGILYEMNWLNHIHSLVIDRR